MTHSTPKKMSAMVNPAVCDRTDSIAMALICSGANAFKYGELARGKSAAAREPNPDEAISVLCSQLEKKKRHVMVVMEGTGEYEYLLLRQLANHKLAAAVINPRRVRDFAKEIGLDAKTDPIDAKVISTYAEVVVPKPMATKSEHELKHSALVARRSQLLELINQENNRLKQSWDDDAKQSIRDVLEVLKKQLKSAGCFWHKCLQGTVLTRVKLKSFSPSKELER